ncbi:MAG: sugar-binding protein [Planctomycetota bacterium]
MRHFAATLGLGLLASLTFNACSRTASDASRPSFAFVTNNVANFWTIARRGVQDAEREFGVQVAFEIPATGSAAEQQEIIEQLIAAGVKGMAISPVDPANQTDMLNQVAERLILICHDSDAPMSRRRAYIGTDNYSAGRAAGQLIKEAVLQGGKMVLFVGTLDAQNARDRQQGILDEIKGSSIVYLDTRTDNSDHARAKANVEEILVSEPDVACLVGLYSWNGPAIAEAVQSAGKVGQVRIVCFDEEEATLQAIKDGVIHGTVVQKPYQFGYQSVRIMKALFDGDDSVIPPNKNIDTGVTVVKKDNVEAFWQELKRLLAPGK